MNKEQELTEREKQTYREEAESALQYGISRCDIDTFKAEVSPVEEGAWVTVRVFISKE